MKSLSVFILYMIAIGTYAQYMTGNNCVDPVAAGDYGYCRDNGLVNCDEQGQATYDLIADNSCCPVGLACICDFSNPDPSYRTVCNVSSEATAGAASTSVPLISIFSD